MLDFLDSSKLFGFCEESFLINCMTCSVLLISGKFIRFEIFSSLPKIKSPMFINFFFRGEMFGVTFGEVFGVFLLIGKPGDFCDSFGELESEPSFDFFFRIWSAIGLLDFFFWRGFLRRAVWMFRFIEVQSRGCIQRRTEMWKGTGFG